MITTSFAEYPPPPIIDDCEQADPEPIMTDEVVDEDPIRCYQSDREELPLSDNDDIENESPRKHTPSVNLKHDSDHSIKELISKRKRAQGKL